MGYKQSPFPMISGSSKHKSALKDKGPEEEGKDHRNVWGKDHKHPPGKPYAETSISKEKKEELTKKGAGFEISETDPHNIHAKKKENQPPAPKFKSPAKQKTYVKPEKEGKGKYHYKKAKHPKKESPPEHKDLEVTKSSAGERRDDINDRIEFLKNDISEGKISAAAGNKKIKSLRASL